MTAGQMETFVGIGLGLALFWNLVLSFLFWRLLRHYRLLAGKSKAGSLDKILERLIKEGEATKKEAEEIKKSLAVLEKSNLLNLSSWGLVRFNPFNETGGNQSFSLALLDGRNSGIVVTSLHTRDGTRVYAKLLRQGKAEDNDLSKEELLAVKQAEKRRKR